MVNPARGEAWTGTRPEQNTRRRQHRRLHVDQRRRPERRGKPDAHAHRNAEHAPDGLTQRIRAAFEAEGCAGRILGMACAEKRADAWNGPDGGKPGRFRSGIVNPTFET